MMAVSAEEIKVARDRFSAVRPEYEQAGQDIADAIMLSCRRAGIACRATTRAKSIASFVTKCWIKNYDDPWGQITDKVGVRVICDNADDIPEVVGIIADQYVVLSSEDKTEALVDRNLVGYAGHHVQIVIPELVGGECEIQVRTAAMDLWATMSHSLVYKPNVDLDRSTKRALVRLQALTEIFDAEVSRAVKELASDPANTYVDLLGPLSEVYYKYNQNEIDASLSKFVLSELGAILDTSALEYCARIEKFGNDFDAKLRGLYERYEGSQDSILLHQPESVIVFERLENAHLQFEDGWPVNLPRSELEFLAAIWGKPVAIS